MNRRSFLIGALAGIEGATADRVIAESPQDHQEGYTGSGQPLPGTAPLTLAGDPAAAMLGGIERFLDRRTAESAARREALWKRDYSSGTYEASIETNRERFRLIIGLADARIPFSAPLIQTEVGHGPVVGDGNGYKVYNVRWPVLEGVDAEGLLLQPDTEPRARVIALPDADCTPEMLAGLQDGIPPAWQFARHLAASGCLVMAPLLIDRDSKHSNLPHFGRSTDMPHREFIYRMAYFVGRHIIGYEVQKVLAAVDWFSKTPGPIGVIGYGEGGLLALYSAAADPRIDRAAVSGYFQSRVGLWAEPIYRNVWGLLTEFGDADIASLIAPRTLVIEASRFPRVRTVEPGGSRKEAAPGRLVTPPSDAVRAEVDRALVHYQRLNAAGRLVFVDSAEPGSDAALTAFLGQRLTRSTPVVPRMQNVRDQKEAVRQLIVFTQKLVRNAESERTKFWSKADGSSIEKWQQTTDWYRRYCWEEITGRIEDPTEPLVARTREIYDEQKWKGYEVVLPVWPDVFAYGLLAVPKNLKAGERRPVVVAQHGLDGRPQDVIMPATKELADSYHRYAALLADRGFIVYAPQNPYVLSDRFRQIQRRANPLKLSLFSFVLGQYQRMLDWLEKLPFVDARRIGYYGLSYGGNTAVRVPPILGRFALSICSANFNEWVWMNALYDTAHPNYLNSTRAHQYEISSDFNFANTFNHAELAKLMTPRPFMVEHGHFDTVAPDEWVAYEFAKVKRHYTLLGIPDRARIDVFVGPHAIHGVETIRALHEWLNWPEPKE